MGIELIDTYVQNHRSFVRYRCDACGYIGTMSKSHFQEGIGCSVCSGKTVIKGINDIATTFPEVACLIMPETDAFLYSGKSSKSVTVKCHTCGFQRSIKISQLTRYGFKCYICHGGYSMPNRFLSALLKQCGIEFEREKTFDWAGRYRYDFYLPEYNLIIELNGAQHYKEVPLWNSLERTNISDREKIRLAKENSISKYIVIPFEKSDIQYIKDQIYTSELFETIGITDEEIDLKAVYELLNIGSAAKCVELWNGGVKDTREIARAANVGMHTVCVYLKQYAEIGLCDYSPVEQLRKSQKNASSHRKSKVICVNTGIVYESIKEAAKRTGASAKSIQNCVSGRAKSAGRDSNNHKLLWRYY